MILDKMRRRQPATPLATAGTRQSSAMATPMASPSVRAVTARPTQVRNSNEPKRVAGPGHSGIIAEGQAWGDWINVRSLGEIELYIRWEGHVTPRVFLYDQQGTPHQLELRAIENGHRKTIELPLGFTYIAVQNMDISPRPIRVMTRLPGFTPPLPGAAPVAA